MKNITMFYSGGMDSHYVLYNALKKGYRIPFVVNFEPVPHSNGFGYFNTFYNKKLIDLHSKLMGIDLVYYRFGDRIGRVFKDDRFIFLNSVIEFILEEARKRLLNDICLLVPWNYDDIIINKKSHERFIKFKKILADKKIDFDFPISNLKKVDIIKKCNLLSINSITVSISGVVEKKLNNEYLSLSKNFLGKRLDVNLYKKLIKIRQDLRSFGINIIDNDLHTVVISSPLLNIKKFSTDDKILIHDSIL